MSHVARIELGGITVDVLCDALADHPSALPEAFPGTPSAGWDAARAAFPATVGADDHWRLPVHVLLVSTATARVLVDAGVGPQGTTAARWLGVAGTLDRDLAELGVDAADVDIVVLTHLHQDHVGWLTAPGAARPTFVRARHVVAGAEWSSVQERGLPLYVQDALMPVQDAGLLDVDGSLLEGLELVSLAGHPPGHSGVLVTGAARRLLFAGDAVNHPVQLTEPDIPSRADGHREQAAATRRALLTRASDETLTVLGAHLPGARWSAGRPAGESV